MPLKLEDEIRENEKTKSMTGKQAKEPASSRPRRQRSVRVVGFIQGQVRHRQKQDYCFDDLRPNSLLVYLFIYFCQTASTITCLVSLTLLQCEVLKGLKIFNSGTWCRWKWRLLQARMDRGGFGSLALAIPVSGDMRRKSLRQLVLGAGSSSCCSSIWLCIGDGKKQRPTQTSLSSPLWRQDHLISPKSLEMTGGKDIASALEDTRAENHLGFFFFLQAGDGNQIIKFSY